MAGQLRLREDGYTLRLDDGGVLRVGKSRISLDLIVGLYENGMTPEDIVRAYDTLVLAGRVRGHRLLPSTSRRNSSVSHVPRPGGGRFARHGGGLEHARLTPDELLMRAVPGSRFMLRLVKRR